MTSEEGQDQNNSIVILSDDEDDVAINQNGKRPFNGKRPSYNDSQAYVRAKQADAFGDSEDEEDYYDDEEMDTEDEEYAMFKQEEEENERNAIYLSRSLPEDHEAVILSERDEVNSLQEIHNVIQELKENVLKTDVLDKDVETGFTCGGPLNVEAPSIALNVIGVPGPIAFPMIEKDATRILSTHPNITDDKGESIGLNLDMAHIEISKTFEEYLNEILRLDIVAFLGVESSVAQDTRMVAKQFHIRTNGGTLQLPDSFGGNILTHYQEDSIKYQPEETAFEGCYYMAWYNNVAVKFQPVTEGHQLAISFSLVRNDTKEDKITIEYLQQRRQEIANGELSQSEVEESKPYIERAVEFFKNSNERPFPIFYMLDYKYTSPLLQVNRLKRPDKLLAEVLKKAAEAADFYMLLGSVEREVEGRVHKDGQPQQHAKNSEEGDECPMDEEGIYLTQKAIYDEYVVRKLYDEQGNNILNISLGLDSGDHPSVIQGAKWYSRCKPTDVDYSGITSVDEEATVKYYYSECQALVFMPKSKLPTLLKMSKAPSKREK
ncbi:hypothetical protein [Parasitella parasitica]|uniref:Uncharacterized protein n=1 Tax=Parasitella parasitica TaxID=35722 RepID=A0A0B7MQS8_9FUNG|nr:hypothetical protein [Parasitella parasitica]